MWFIVYYDRYPLYELFSKWFESISQRQVFFNIQQPAPDFETNITGNKILFKAKAQTQSMARGRNEREILEENDLLCKFQRQQRDSNSHTIRNENNIVGMKSFSFCKLAQPRGTFKLFRTARLGAARLLCCYLNQQMDRL